MHGGQRSRNALPGKPCCMEKRGPSGVVKSDGHQGSIAASVTVLVV